MKFKRIELINNEVLGNLTLDFTDKNGKILDTIILAGENGVGKSYLLNLLFEFSNLILNLNSPKRNEKRIFEIELSDKDIENIRKGENYEKLLPLQIQKNQIKISIDFNGNGANWSKVTILTVDSSQQKITLPGYILTDVLFKKVLKSIFSDAEINFTPRNIKTVTSKNIDIENPESVRSSENLATEITQLLIDVQSIDALDFTEWARKNPGNTIDESKIDTRLKRFTNAFHFIFPAKRYKRIENKNNYKEVIFEENGKEMSIEKLSSGEKQIVFRGSFLLKDKESSKGAIVLIDEPEISLHPTWQLKILNYFKKLFTNENGEQTSQIIIATHSPFIIHNANRNDDKVIILLKNSDGNTVVSQNPKFYSWSPEKIIEEAFNVSHILSENKMTVFVEGATDEKYFNTCMEIFGKPASEIEFKWIGRMNEKGQPENTGDSALNQAKTFFHANMDIIKGSVVLLYDSDTDKPEENIEKLLVRRMEFNKYNILFKKGVENLLSLPKEFEVKKFYNERNTVDDYGGETLKKVLDKTRICSYICENIDIETQKLILANIAKEIDRLLIDKEKYFKQK